MDTQFWLERWRSGEIGFHREDAHAGLRQFWSRLGLVAGGRVLVPLCGMSPDMVWLADAGHQVLGVELSEIAVAAFFEAQDLTPSVRDESGFEVFSAGPYEIWVGDIFELPGHVIASCAAVYDRASLVALPDDMQVDYVALLRDHLPAGGQMLLVSLSYDTGEMDGPPFSTPLARIKALFEPAFSVELLVEAEALELNDNLQQRGLTALTEGCYQLQMQAAG